MKKPIIALSVLAVLAGVSVGAFLIVKNKNDQNVKQEQEKIEDRVLFKMDNINRLDIYIDDTVYTAELSEDYWYLSNPVSEKFVLNQDKLKSMEGNIANLTAVESYGEASDEKKKTYGLDNPFKVTAYDGEKVQTYLNYEKSDETEDDAIERRQNVLTAFFAALSRNEKIIKDKKSFDVISEKMTSNLDDKEFYRLMTIISQVDSEHLIPRTITGSKRVVDGKTLLFPLYDGDFIKQVFKQVSNSLITLGNTNVNRTYVLEILNGTTVQGLARNTMILLQSAGYDILTTGNADSNDYEKTVIINHIGNAEIAKSLGDFIRCTNIVEEAVISDDDTSTASNVDFTIILGKDFDGRYVKK